MPNSITQAALTGLKVGGLFTLPGYPKIYDIYVRSGEPEEYLTYRTPERKMFNDAYLENRRRAGEGITKDLPLI